MPKITVTYNDLLAAEQAIEPTRENYDFRRTISDVLAAAEDNAPESDSKGRIDSIICSLSHNEYPAAVVTWFASFNIIP